MEDKEIIQRIDDAVEEVAVITHNAIKQETDTLRAEMKEMKEELRGEMREMKDELRAEMSEMKGEMNVMKEDIRSLKSGQQAILEVVQSIDQQLKEHRDLPMRVARLERSVFRG